MGLRGRVASLVLAGLVVLAAGCGESAPERQLEAARELWAKQGFERYVIDVSGDLCPGPCGPFRVTVEGGEVVSVRPAPGSTQDEVPADLPDLTVEALFEQLEQALERTTNIAVMADPVTGAPATVTIVEPEGRVGGFTAYLVLPVPGAAARGARACESAPGTTTDVAGGPAWSNWQDTWVTDDGCLVRGDVVTSFRGSRHCRWESAQTIVTGEPIGALFASQPQSSFADIQAGVWYFRDPDGVIGDAALEEGFDPDAELPAAAVDTGFRRGDEELWAVPGAGDAIYLRTGDRVERWPRDPDPVLCE